MDSVLVTSPIGTLKVSADHGCLLQVALVSSNSKSLKPRDVAAEPANVRVLAAAKKQIEEYFSGRRRDFDLPVKFAGTQFQQEVWGALREIPYGKTQAYSQIAKTVGRPKAQRAVGAACGKNEHLIIVPCHRVVASHGLGGFSSPLRAKKILLAIESASHL